LTGFSTVEHVKAKNREHVRGAAYRYVVTPTLLMKSPSRRLRKVLFASNLFPMHLEPCAVKHSQARPDGAVTTLHRKGAEQG